MDPLDTSTLSKLKDNSTILQRKLEDRSYLRFEFYDSPTQAPNVRYLLFYEDPEIRETRKASYAKYQPLSRNSTLLAHTGAESRIINVLFRMTMPHIAATSDLTMENKKTQVLTNDELRNRILNGNKETENYSMESKKGSAKHHTLEYLNLLDDDSNAISTNKTKTADLIMYWVNLIRVAVLNNAKNPTKGPPIIRLNHGILYQDVPCVLLDYKIDYDKAHGVDMYTLLPRVITIDINLQEIRIGDFGDFDVTNIVKRDNTVGWEVMLDVTNTTDPIRINLTNR